MFDGILDAAMPEKVSTLGVTRENPELPLANPIYSYQTQNNKMNSQTESTSPFPDGGELTHWVEKAKNV